MSLIADPITWLIYFEEGKDKEAHKRTEKYQEKLFSQIKDNIEEELLNKQKQLIKNLQKMYDDGLSEIHDENFSWATLKEVHDFFNKWCCYKSEKKIPQDYVHKSLFEVVELLKIYDTVLKETLEKIKKITKILIENFTGVYIDVLNS